MRRTTQGSRRELELAAIAEQICSLCGHRFHDTLRGVPWPRQYSYRVLKNKLTDEWADREAEAFRAFGTLSEKYVQARAQNDLDVVGVACGEAVGVLRDRPTAESIAANPRPSAMPPAARSKVPGERRFR